MKLIHIQAINTNSDKCQVLARSIVVSVYRINTFGKKLNEMITDSTNLSKRFKPNNNLTTQKLEVDCIDNEKSKSSDKSA